MRFWLLALAFTSIAQASEIGEISEFRGNGEIIRKDNEDKLTAVIDLGILSYDDVRTGNGRMAIEFLDSSVLKLTEHSKVVIDNYIYDPDPSKSKLALNMASGTARFITGALGRINKENISIRTPSATIAIRGTDFTTTVDELGRSLIILLPDAYGLSSGEIEVVTAMGSVLLNKPFQATTVSVFESAPSKPVILDLTLDIIDNMLIVTPPKKEMTLTEEVSQNAKANILDFNDLDIDYLDEDFLGEDELEFTELDINYLDTNFLEDLLNVLDSLAVGEDEDVLADASRVNLTGTKFGQDPETQITTLIAGEVISLRRKVNDSIRLDLNKEGSYTVIIIQDGVSNVVKINGGGDSNITITQTE